MKPKLSKIIYLLQQIAPEYLDKFYKIIDLRLENDTIALSKLSEQLCNNLKNKIISLTTSQLEEIRKLTFIIEYIQFISKVDNTVKHNNIIEKNPINPDNTSDSSTCYDLSTDYNFSKKKPIGFIFENTSYDNIKNWRHLLYTTCQILLKKDSNLFNSLPYNSDLIGKKNGTYFSFYKNKATLPQKKAIIKPYKIPSSKVYIETNLNTQSLVNLIRKLLSIYNIPLFEYTIIISNNNSNDELNSPNSSLKTDLNNSPISKNNCIYYKNNHCIKFNTSYCYSSKTNCQYYTKKYKN